MLGDGSSRVVDEPLNILHSTFNITCVSMGNPHCVIFVDDVEKFPVEKYGPFIENHELFPRRTNVEFVQIISRSEVRQRTWERGAGETLACGTGASAVTVACVLNGLTEKRILNHLSGGDLEMEWPENGPVYMTGPAVQVFTRGNHAVGISRLRRQERNTFMDYLGAHMSISGGLSKAIDRGVRPAAA